MTTKKITSVFDKYQNLFLLLNPTTRPTMIPTTIPIEITARIKIINRRLNKFKRKRSYFFVLLKKNQILDNYH